MKHILVTAVLLACGIVSAQATDIRERYVRQQVVVRQEREPLKQIPVVGTVVYGGLNYAGALILSPTELITGPRR